MVTVDQVAGGGLAAEHLLAASRVGANGQRPPSPRLAFLEAAESFLGLLTDPGPDDLPGVLVARCE